MLFYREKNKKYRLGARKYYIEATAFLGGEDGLTSKESMRGAGVYRQDKGMALAFISDVPHRNIFTRLLLFLPSNLEGKIHIEKYEDLRFDKRS